MTVCFLPRLVLVVAVAGVAGSAHAGTVFFDDFDGENAGLPAINYAGFANWTVTDGAADLIGPGLSDVYPGNGLYVDLDGTSNNAATLTSNVDISLAAGAFVLSFDLGDTNFLAGAPSDPNGMVVSVLDGAGGVLVSELFESSDTSAGSLLGQQIGFSLADAGGITIVFEHEAPSAGLGDNFGLVIDNVAVTTVPAPGPLALSCMAGMIAARRRR